MNPELRHFLHGVRVGEGDEAEAPGVLGGGVSHHHRLRHGAELAEIFLQTLCNNRTSELVIYPLQSTSPLTLGCLPRQAADKHFAAEK